MTLRLLACAIVAGLALNGRAQTLFTVSSDRPGCRYGVGETVTYTVTATDEKGAPFSSGTVAWSLDNFGTDVISPSAEVDLAAGNPFRVTGRLPYPGFLRLCLKAADGSSRVWSVAVAPERVRASSPRPDDFDAFWDGAIAKLAREVPLDPQMERVAEKSKGAFDYYNVSFATFGGRVYGFLTIPKDRSRKYPALVKVPGAGPYHNASGYGSGERVTLMMNVLPFKPDADNAKFKAAYQKWEDGLKKKYGTKGQYGTAGIAVSREDYVFYPIILGISRAVDWLAARPEVDAAHIGYHGGSQGGGFGYFLLGLNRNFTRGAMYIPAMADHLADRARRRATWPEMIRCQCASGRAAAEKNAPYFDIAHFAPRIRVPVRTIIGLSDMTCPPAGGWSAFNALASNDKAMTSVPGMTHAIDPALERDLFKWVCGTEPAFVAPPRSPDSNAVQVLAQLKNVARSPNYYWAWTYPWLDHGKRTGDRRNVEERDGRFLPKPLADVKLSCEYMKFADGRRTLINYADLASVVGTWHSPRYYAVNRAGLTAAIQKQWAEFGAIMVFNWHMDQPYCTNGFPQASYRFKSVGANRNVIRQILDGTGDPCGTGTIDGKSYRNAFKNPRDWFLDSLADIADFFNGLNDPETGKPIPVILRYPHEADGNWFWWGEGWCMAEEFRALCRFEADYLRRVCGPDRILFAYTPDKQWRGFGKEGDTANTFLARYPGDAYTDIIGIDDYSIGNGKTKDDAERNLEMTIDRLRQMSAFAAERNLVACVSESGGRWKRDDFWQYLHRAATAKGVACAFVNTWSTLWGTLPNTPASEADERAFARRSEVLMEGADAGFNRRAERVMLIGDSITEMAWTMKPSGFYHQLTNAVAHVCPEHAPAFIPLGYSGYRVGTWKQMEQDARKRAFPAKFDKSRSLKSVLDAGAETIVVFLGMNDLLLPTVSEDPASHKAWLADYAAFVTNLTARCRPKRFVFASITPLTADAESPKNEVRRRLNALLRGYAASVGAAYADCGAAIEALQAKTRTFRTDYRLVPDFIHPNGLGHTALARELCRALGREDLVAHFTDRLDAEVRAVENAAKKPSLSVRLLPDRRQNTADADELTYRVDWHANGADVATVDVTVPAGWCVVRKERTGGNAGCVVVRGTPRQLRNRVVLTAGAAEATVDIAPPWRVSEPFDFPNAWRADPASGRAVWCTNAVPPVTRQTAGGWLLSTPTWDYGGSEKGRLDPGSLDAFQLFFGGRTDSFYAVRWIKAPSDMELSGVLTHSTFSATLGFHVFVDGVEQFAGTLDRQGGNRTVGRVRLHKGWNELTIRCDHKDWQRQFAFNLETRAGREPDGLTYAWKPPRP